MRADVFTKVAAAFVALTILTAVALPRIERLAHEATPPPPTELQRGVLLEASARGNG